jgi:hypothetical protein
MGGIFTVHGALIAPFIQSLSTWSAFAAGTRNHRGGFYIIFT